MAASWCVALSADKTLTLKERFGEYKLYVIYVNKFCKRITSKKYKKCFINIQLEIKKGT